MSVRKRSVPPNGPAPHRAILPRFTGSPGQVRNTLPPGVRTREQAGAGVKRSTPGPDLPALCSARVLRRPANGSAPRSGRVTRNTPRQGTLVRPTPRHPAREVQAAIRRRHAREIQDPTPRRHAPEAPDPTPHRQDRREEADRLRHPEAAAEGAGNPLSIPNTT